MKRIIIAAVVLMMIFALAACDVMFGMFQPDYAGTWSVTETGGLIDMKMVYEFSRTEYQYSMYFVGEDDVLIDYSISRGLVEGTDTSLTVTPVRYKEIEMESWGEQTFDDLEWADVPAENATPVTITWAIDGDTLTLTTPSETEGADPDVLTLTREDETAE